MTRPRPPAFLATALLAALVALLVFTRHNDFAFFYHTDEPGKVRQVLTGERNYHHPLLLLRSTELYMRLAGTPSAAQPVVEAGRTMSAVFAALAVGMFVLLAGNLGGLAAAVVCALLLVTHPVLFELSHYMKEDCALLFGTAACFLAMQVYSRRPTLSMAVLAGAAGGLAVSGKYIGLAMAVTGLALVVATPSGRGRRRPALGFIVAAALVFAAINWESLINLHGARGGLEGEFDRLDLRAAEKGGIQFKYLSKFGGVIPVPVLLALAFWGWCRWRQRAAEPLFTWVLLGFPFIYLIVLGFTPATKERYLLPSFMLFTVLGALGIAEIAKTFGARGRQIAALTALAALGWHLVPLVGYWREFRSDDRLDLVLWMRANVPADTLLAHDARVRFAEGIKSGDPRFALPQQLLPRPERYVADLGTLNELRARGVGYVAVCEQDFHSALRLKSNQDATADRRRLFYKELFASGKPLWERPPGKIAYLHPGLRLYRLGL